MLFLSFLYHVVHFCASHFVQSIHILLEVNLSGLVCQVRQQIDCIFRIADLNRRSKRIALFGHGVEFRHLTAV